MDNPRALLVDPARLPSELEAIAGEATGHGRDAGVLRARAAILAAWGRTREARIELSRVAALDPGPDAQVEAANADLRAGDATNAQARLERVVARDRGHAGAAVGLADVRLAQGRSAEALALVSAHVDDANVGLRARLAAISALASLGRRQEALALARSTSGRHAGSAAAWELLGIELAADSHLEEALAAFRESMRLAKETGEAVDAWVNLGIALCGAGRHREGVQELIQGLGERPDANGFLQLSAECLRLGDFRGGFRLYEHRWWVDALAPLRARIGLPVWRGQDLRGKTILVRAEQGIGDVFQFARYLRELRRIGARVLFQPLQILAPLAHRFDGVDEVVAPGRPLVDVDFFANLMSLPVGFGTELDSIPPGTPAYFSPDPARVATWRARMRQTVGAGALIVGLVWAGRPGHSRDRFRSLGLDQLGSLLRVPGVHFLSLQKGVAVAQAEAVPEFARWESLGPELDDLDDAAAAIASLDLLIGVDTGLIHIAGAMGVPAWAMIPEPSDFRWLVGREDTPWYPSIRLFRQRDIAAWPEVVERVTAALAGVASHAGDRRTPVERTGTPSRPAGPDRTSTPIRLPRHLAAAPETRAGLLVVDPDDATQGTSLDVYGEWLPELLAVVTRYATAGATVLEAAAGAGAHSIPLAAILGAAGHLILYERDPRRRRILDRNLSLHSIQNATSMTRALSGPHEGGFSAERETVDDLGLERLDGLKINEGADAAAIMDGATGTMWRCRPWLVLAQEDDAALTRLAERIREYGYRTWRMETPLFNPDNFNRRTDDIFDGKTALTLVALPEESRLPEPGAGCVELR